LLYIHHIFSNEENCKKMSYNYTQKWANMFAKPLENAAMCYLGGKMLGIDTYLDNPIIGQQDGPTSLAFGGFLASFVTETVHSWILPSVGSQWYTTASMVVSPALQTGGLYAYVAYLNSGAAQAIGPMNFGILGAGGEIASTYVNNAFVSPWLDGY
jgi:hypothetical protein